MTGCKCIRTGTTVHVTCMACTQRRGTARAQFAAAVAAARLAFAKAGA